MEDQDLKSLLYLSKVTPILEWLEETTEWEYNYSVNDNFVYIEIILGKLNCKILINMDNNSYNWKISHNINLLNIDNYYDIILSLRNYYDKVYRVKKRNKKFVLKY
jgi:hypothetical protein